eukprot:2088600-Rhodomonas_salina.2
MEDGGWRMEDGGWRMEDAGWKMTEGGRGGGWRGRSTEEIGRKMRIEEAEDEERRGKRQKKRRKRVREALNVFAGASEIRAGSVKSDLGFGIELLGLGHVEAFVTLGAQLGCLPHQRFPAREGGRGRDCEVEGGKREDGGSERGWWRCQHKTNCLASDTAMTRVIL